jgi:UDP-N-acetylglucosamine--N-acetylmuramyl-(pentapeptide) pyrophosphoryl-undecaprenol N-acetylglucosamine transferase
VLPFLDDVARAVADADVVVARAGASTLGELTAIGRAAILVPYPHAAADHQGQNAEALARAGGSVCVRQNDATPERLSREIERLLGDDTARVRMADASRARGRPRAAADVASDLLDVAGIARRRRPSSTNGTTLGHPATTQEVR